MVIFTCRDLKLISFAMVDFKSFPDCTDTSKAGISLREIFIEPEVFERMKDGPRRGAGGGLPGGPVWCHVAAWQPSPQGQALRPLPSRVYQMALLALVGGSAKETAN